MKRFVALALCCMFALHPATLLAEPITADAKASDIRNLEAALAKGQSPDEIVDKAGSRLIDVAIVGDRPDIVRFLLDHGANFNAGANAGRQSPLHMAAFMGETDVILLLLDKGAPINSLNSQGATPLGLAALQGKAAAVALLAQRGADLNAKNSDGFTPLMLAARFGKTDAVTALVFAGADKTIRDQNGRSAADFANQATDLSADAKYGTLAALNLSHRTTQTSDNAQEPVPCNDIEEVARRIVKANPGIRPEILMRAIRTQQELRGCIAPQPGR